MVISKTPLRIPLAGGLTDLKGYAHRFGGVTLSSTVDKFVYVMLKQSADDRYELQYQGMRDVANEVIDIKNDLIRETLLLTGLTNIPLSITISTDVATESGLGSSGAITVSLLHAMHRFAGREPSPEQLLQEAAHVEVDRLDGASGYHDPSICALGGLRLLEYTQDGIHPCPLEIAPDTLEAFQRSLLFFYSGHHAKSKPSLDLLSSHLDHALPVLHELRALGYALADAFTKGDMAAIAHAIGQQQVLKQRLPGKFTDEYVRDVTERVRRAGAYAQLPGGKISAFVIVCCPRDEHAAVRRELADLQEVFFTLEPQGTRAIIF